MTKIISIASALCMILLPIGLSAQTVDTIALLDSLYWDKKYDDMVTIATERLERESDLYTEVAAKYYLANALFKRSEFPKTWALVVENHEASKSLNMLDSSHVRMVVDQSQKVGDYSFLAEEYAIGKSALAYGIKTLENHLSNDLWRKVKLLHKAGAVSRISNDLEAAEQYLQSGIQTIPQLPEVQQGRIEPVFQAEMAEVYNDSNQPQKAVTIYKQMLTAAQKQNNLTRLSIYNNNIGLAYERMRDFGKAKYHFQKGLEAKIEKWGTEDVNIIIGYTNLGRISTKLGEPATAREYYAILLDLTNEMFEPNSIKLADTYYSIGMSYLSESKYDTAQIYYQKAWDNRALHVGTEDLKLTDAQQMVGFCMVKQGEVDQGIKLLLTSANDRSTKKITQDYELVNTYVYLHDAYLQRGDEDLADQMLVLAFTAIGYNIDDPYAFEKVQIPSGLVVPMTKRLARLSNQLHTQHKNDPIKVADALITYLKYSYDDRDSKKVLAKDTDLLYEAMVDYLYTSYEQNHSQETLNRILAVTERSNNTFLYEELASDQSVKSSASNQLNDARRNLIKQIDSSQQAINELGSIESRDEVQYKNLLSKLTTDKSKLYDVMESIRTKDPEYYHLRYNYPVADISAVRRSLAIDQVVLSYYFGAEALYLMIIRNDVCEIKKVGSKKDIKEDILNLHAMISKKASQQVIMASATDLYEVMIGQHGIAPDEKLLVVADDVVARLPFDVLLYSQGIDLFERQQISFLHSASLMANPLPVAAKDQQYLLAMAPVFDGGLLAWSDPADAVRGPKLGPIPESRTEVNNITAIWKTKPYIYSDASLAQFLAIAPQASVIHLATHAIIDENTPGLSYLAFAQTDSTSSSILQANDISRMDLNAELVTLSACNTGSGEIQQGEGVASIGRAFVYAGCPNLLMTLWSVSDQSTTQLLTDYYANLHEGQDKIEALHQSKVNYLKSSPQALRHPYYWSGLVYYGESGPLRQFESTNFGWIGVGIVGLIGMMVWFVFGRIRRS